MIISKIVSDMHAITHQLSWRCSAAIIPQNNSIRPNTENSMVKDTFMASKSLME